MEIRQGYKQTEIGIIPEEWEVKKLGECFEVIMGQSPSSKSYNEEEEGLPLVQGNADIRNNKVYPRMYTSEITKESYPNDLIMTVRAPVGDVYISDIHSCIGRGICAIRNGNKYLYYYLFNYKDKWERLAQGSTFTAITVKEVKDLNIPIPPLKEQEKIAEILLYYDKAIEQQELLIEKEKEFKKGMMQKIFSQEIRFKDDNGEDYPEWEEKRLGDIFERITEKNTENNTNVLTISAQYGLISQTNFFNKSVAGKDLSKYYLLKKDDFAYNKSYSNGYPFGAIKKLNRYEKGIVSTLYICFRLKNRNNLVDFFEQFFESKKIDKNIQDIAQEGARNHGLLNINIQDFFDITKYIPSIQEQEKIANFLSDIDNKIKLLENKLELLKNEKKGMMQKLLTGEVRV